MAPPKEPPKEWKKLSPYQHARLRTEMYFGSRDPHTQTVLEYEAGGPVAKETTWVPAVFTAFREVLDNALDEVAAHGHGDRIEVTYDEKKMVVVIKDNGRGIPIDFDKTEKKHAATVLLSETMAGRNFEDDRGATRGLNGVGASIVNFCSEYFHVTIFRDKKEFDQQFEEGVEHITNEPIIMPFKGLGTGTRIEFKLSRKVFKDLRLPESFILARMYEVALCYPKLKLFYNGDQIKLKSIEKDIFPKHKPITFEIEEGNFKSNFWLVPKFFDDNSEMAHGLVNAIPMFNGGVHIDSFKRNFFAGMIKALEPQSKKRKLTPNRSDLADGMLIFNITQMDAPEFDSQSKTRMINEGVSKIINAAMTDEDFYKKVIRTNPEWIESIYEKCAERTMKKDSAEVAKLAKKRKKVEKLKDATSYDRSKCVLFLGEGDSAISGLNEARDPVIHGGLALRGKVMNVHGMKPREIYENKELASIIDTLGLVPGQRANRHNLRYSAVYIATDADEDGKNIAALLTNFFFSCWPELFDGTKPFLHVFETPLIIAVKGKQRKYWYADNYEKFDAEAHKGWEITRAKGLAALKKDDWKYVLANPKLIPIVNDGKLSDSLDMIFNTKRADERKEWIGM
jgi:DNA gyrase/topoisomerase IV subunit B